MYTRSRSRSLPCEWCWRPEFGGVGMLEDMIDDVGGARLGKVKPLDVNAAASDDVDAKVDVKAGDERDAVTDAPYAGTRDRGPALVGSFTCGSGASVSAVEKPPSRSHSSFV